MFFYRTLFLFKGLISMPANVSACAVAGLGGLGNEVKRNAKTDQLRLVPHDKCK